MSDFEEKLNSILGNEAAMNQIMSLARALSGGEEAQRPKREDAVDASFTEVEGQMPGTQPDQQARPGGGKEGPADLSALLGLLRGGEQDGKSEGNDLLSMLGGLDPKLLQMGMQLFREYNRPDDDKTALLMALRPFVKEKRYAKMDRAVQIARLSRLIRVALELFGQGKDGKEV